MRIICWLICVAVTFLFVSASHAAEWGLKKGTPELKSAGQLAFGPDGILLVGDVQNSAVVAIDTGDSEGDPNKVDLNVEGLNEKVASLLEVRPQDIAINDLAVNPVSGNVFLSVSMKGGDDIAPALVRIAGSGKLSQVDLQNVSFAKVKLPAQENQRTNGRHPAITDLAYTDGKVLLSGSIPNPAGGRPLALVREIPFPFTTADAGFQIEIYHGAHGRFENYATVRTFVPFNIDGKPSLLAGFTCTPLVRFDLRSTQSKEKVRGTTIAELGNRNTPYDMIVYEKDGKTFVLMANDRRGVMKISTKGIDRREGITEHVPGGGVAGQEYETIKELEGTVQLDRLNDEHAILVVKTEAGQNLKTVALP